MVYLVERPPINRRSKQCFFLQGSEELVREEGVALGMPIQIRHQARPVRCREAVSIPDEEIESRLVEAPYIQPQAVRLAYQCGQLLREGVTACEFVAPIGDE